VPAANISSTNLAEIPPLRLRLKLRYDTGRYFAEAEGIFAGAQTYYNTDLLETQTPGYGTANLLAGMNLGAVTVQLIASNIFDALYYENLSYQRDPFRSGVRVYEPGANFFINFSYRFGGR
jgi:iron complex outermembrane receptor protein